MRNNKIFVVDDEPFTRKFVTKILNRAGFEEVVEFESGEAALRKLGLSNKNTGDTLYIFPDSSADLVLLDIMMPGSDGFEVCRIIKDEYPDLPVILMSSLYNENDQLKGFESGADAYETKPVNQKRLISIINKLLNNKQSKEQLVADYENLKTLHKTLPPFIRKKTDVIDKYSILKTLGTGANAIVYEVEDEDRDRYALKILSDKVASDPENISLFTHEIKNLILLSHPNIIKIYNYGLQEGFPYYIMEKVDGRTLSNYVNNMGPMPIEKFKIIVTKIAAALDYIHANEIIHRDIKLDNIMIDDFSDIKITDFGLAIEGKSQSTEVYGVAGTPLYMAPEVITGQSVSVKSDVYAFGICIYCLATGTMPFESERIQELIHSHCNVTPERVDSINPEIPTEWADIIQSCLEKNPSKRPEFLIDYIDGFDCFDQTAN